ncbi:MAG TPA: Stp1/IreP family PP2C-type Ser/Thr phosphatase [Thermoleophilaceae bacterium]|nr:Stp1/IreP family PP2C-type Ser/Thr phosphatase [Thermoleophilaceae bacterium]
MPVFVVEEVGLTDVGRERQSNEDSFVEAPPVFAVADGMGGARAGEVASRMAVEAFGQAPEEGAEPEAQLVAIARDANRRIYEMAHSDDAYAGMGTTLTAVMVSGHEVTVGHVGDSRLYRLRDGGLERLTNDHSLVEEYVRAGRLAPEEAESHPQKSIITRALGVEADVEVDTLTCNANDGDVYLLCSDGLSGMVSEHEMAETLLERSSLEQAARALIDAANRAGGRDNITVVLFRLSEGGGAMGDGDDRDTLSGEETQTGLHTSQVQTALAAAEAQETTAGEPQNREPRPGAARADETLVVDARTAEAARAGDAAKPAAGTAAAAARRRSRARNRRRVLAGLLSVLALAGLVAGLLVAARSVYFVGASDAGLVALYRGLPYELPFGVELYEEVYESTEPARALPEPQRTNVLDHRLRTRRDAADLVRQAERGRIDSLTARGSR